MASTANAELTLPLSNALGPPDFPAPSILDYKPESTLVTEEHQVRSARYPTVDIHSHHRQPMTPERMASLAAEMDELNLRTIVDLSGGSGESLRKDVAPRQPTTMTTTGRDEAYGSVC